MNKVVESTLVMPESAVPHAEPEVETDSFAYYTRLIEELFSEKEDLVSLGRPCPIVEGSDIDANHCGINRTLSTSLSRTFFCNGLGEGISLSKKERLEASLKQSVTGIGKEVDQALKSVKDFRTVEYLLDKELFANNPGSADSGSNQHCNKKQKVSSSPSSTCVPSHAGTLDSQSCEGTSGSEDIDSKDNNVVSSEESQCRGLQKICLDCKTRSTPQWRGGPDGRKTLCNACGLRRKKNKMSPLDFIHEEKLKQELDENMRIVVDVGGTLAKDLVKQYSDEFFAELGHMEEQLENYINLTTSRCRNMTTEEKVELRKRIQNLPPQNLDRVADIILQHRKLPEEHPCDEIHIDLENEDNVTLWRLYYYVAASKRAVADR